MEHQLTAIFESGILRPLQVLELPEHATVTIQIHQVVPAAETALHRQKLHATLKAANLVRHEGSKAQYSRKLSVSRRTELARRLAVGKPLSEVIIEEREG